MGYRLVPYNGDTVAVPQLVFTHLAQADGDTIRAALYILQTGDTDPRTMARALGLPSIEAAKRALQYWAGAGLLENERGGSPAPAAEQTRSTRMLTTFTGSRFKPTGIPTGGQRFAARWERLPKRNCRK